MAGVKGKSGGFRVGAGRKRRDPKAAWLGGNAGKRGGPKARPVTAPKADVSRPDGMSKEDAAVWSELAPHALEQGTLIPATVTAFAWLCSLVVLERKLRAAPLAVAGPDHRGMMQRVEAGFARFRLTADGKPVVVEAANDAFAEFLPPLAVIHGGKN